MTLLPFFGSSSLFFFFFNDTATTEIYTLFPTRRSSDLRADHAHVDVDGRRPADAIEAALLQEDRKSTRLNSSHRTISYAVFCLKKKKKSANDDLEAGVVTSTMCVK